MDLFSSIANEIKPAANVDAEVNELCIFVKGLSHHQLKHLELSLKEIDSDERGQALLSMQAFAYEEGLKDDWWRIVNILHEARKGEMWNAGWSAAYDHSVAILLRPYFGKIISQKHYTMITTPLNKLKEEEKVFV